VCVAHGVHVVLVAVSYAAPNVSTVTGGTLLPTAGGARVTITGTAFGPGSNSTSANTFFSLSPGIQYGSYGVNASGCNVTTTGGVATMVCTTVPGVGAALPLVVVVGNQQSRQSGTLSYSPPSVSTVSLAVLSTAGGENVTITGSNFGPVGPVSVILTSAGINYTATSCAVAVAHVTIECVTPAGTGVNYAWMVVVGGQSGMSSATSSYGPPSLLTVSSSANLAALATVGGETITINGTNFGSTGAFTVILSSSAARLNYTATACTLTVPHVTIQCLTPAGVGVNYTWIVIVGGQSGVSASSFLASYGAPVLMSVPQSRFATTGGTVFLLQGSGFGPPNTSASLLSVTFGPASNPRAVNFSSCSFVNDTTVQCTSVQGAGAGLQVVVIVAGQASPAAGNCEYRART
jgi:hypothetical protein